jgi:hypothetical protein
MYTKIKPNELAGPLEDSTLRIYMNTLISLPNPFHPTEFFPLRPTRRSVREMIVWSGASNYLACEKVIQALLALRAVSKLHRVHATSALVSLAHRSIIPVHESDQRSISESMPNLLPPRLPKYRYLASELQYAVGKKIELMHCGDSRYATSSFTIK